MIRRIGARDGAIRRVATRGVACFAALIALATLCGSTRGPIDIGPGAGIRTRIPAMIHPLREDVSVTPILSVGDTLAPPDTVTIPYVFPPLPTGLGVRKTKNGIAEIYVTHAIPWGSVLGGSEVSRLALDLRNLGVLAGDELVDGSEGYSNLSATTLVGPRDGFLTPALLVNEGSIDGPYHGIAAAVDARDGTVTNLPWLGFFSHESTIIVPVSSGKIVAILTEDGVPGESQLYMYVAENDKDFLAGRGQLYVFRANPVPGHQNTRLPSMADKFRPLTGTFVPVGVDFSRPIAELPARLEAAAQSAGCLNFVRLTDAAADQSQPNQFYVNDRGASNFVDPWTGRPVTGAGRVYAVRLNPFQPTVVEEMSVLLDGDDSDDIYRPDNLDLDDRYLWIQEDPGSTRGLHTARILRYDTRARRLESMAECAEADAKGRLLPKGVGGVWESTGILNVSDILGPDTWLVAVQAPNLETSPFRRRGGGGQLLLLRGPGYPRAEPPRATAKQDKKASPEPKAP